MHKGRLVQLHEAEQAWGQGPMQQEEWWEKGWGLLGKRQYGMGLRGRKKAENRLSCILIRSLLCNCLFAPHVFEHLWWLAKFISLFCGKQRQMGA
jgi:hypothetical protein